MLDTILTKAPHRVLSVLSVLREAGCGAYAVGGCLGDILLGQEPGDWDLCTSARPETVLALFPETPADTRGLPFGSVTLVFGKERLEVTTFRREGAYPDRRHPAAVEFTDSIEEDLRRRDFTVNAMAWAPGEGLTDPFGGVRDCGEKRLVCVGVPEVRFGEDPLRILRGLRFLARFGLTAEPETRAALFSRAEGIRSLPPERIRTELGKLFLGADWERVFTEYGPVLRLAGQLLPAPQSLRQLRRLGKGMVPAAHEALISLLPVPPELLEEYEKRRKQKA